MSLAGIIEAVSIYRIGVNVNTVRTMSSIQTISFCQETA
jgi:hypothetical protein